MGEFVLIIVISIVVETIIEWLKKALPIVMSKTGVIFAISAILGIGAAIAFNADIFVACGYESSIPAIGQILTGILCGGGSNVVYDVVKRIRGDE